ncbi:hypothetical protein LTR78_003499 [Recurvomyces mirabilis]|uniref:Uncharacterized protein n=1 Tax=Recurvomyces mirabilis TaxID=574656 RepID=A0AAE0WRW2_9PEZI|nr:hypothetical protein LTR78_003499 [Recurvomyces mirabilis]KAK5154468.1 hypothetical protein LTS14_006603 [Recurvomyces mirabilis]
MSWLSPKRRKTTGNLQTKVNGTNGQGNGRAGSDTEAPPSPATTRTSAGAERPPVTPTRRPFSQPAIDRNDTSTQVEKEHDGNLFYAYARTGNDLQSRYLLTFASASIANEWWHLLQANFTETSRPGPQLFSFVDPPDLLSKAWKHPAFAHLKSKWMYISFSDTQDGGLGGAAQGIIPVQDAQGHMLSGSALAPSSPELAGAMGEMKKQSKEVGKEITKLEEYFVKMMEAVDRNTEQVAALAERQMTMRQSEESEKSGYFEGTELSSHLNRVNELLERHSEHMVNLSKQQSENDRKLSNAMADMAGRQKNDYLDMAQLSSHLDRIQSLMEQDSTERKDNAKSSVEQQARPTQIDFSPLIDKLEKVQEAVEQNSALVKALLEEGSAPESKPGTPFWGKDAAAQMTAAPPTMDLSPLTEHLQMIHHAIEQQSSHMQALVGFATGGGDEEVPNELAGTGAGGNGVPGGGTRGGDTAEKSLAPLGEHLEQIYNAIEEGNAFARSTGRISLEPLIEKMEEMRVAVGSNKSELDLTPLAEKMEATRQAVQDTKSTFDMSPLASKFDGLSQQLAELIHGSSMASERFEVLLQHHAKFENTILDPPSSPQDLQPLANKFDGLHEQLAKIATASERTHDQTRELVGAHGRLHEVLADSGRDGIDFSPLTEQLSEVNSHLVALREWVEHDSEQLTELVAAQHVTKELLESGAHGNNSDSGSLIEHLQAMRTATEQNLEHIRAFTESQQKISSTQIPPLKPDIDLTPLTNRLNRIHKSIERQATEQKQYRDTSPGTGDAKFIMSALTSHLSKIQAVTEANAAHVKTIRETQSQTVDKVHTAIASTSEAVATLTKQTGQRDQDVARQRMSTTQQLADSRKTSDSRIEAQNAQIRDLTKAQKEIVDVMRELSKGLLTQAKVKPDQDVLPPPRKVGRKIVGFVYEGKEAAIAAGSRKGSVSLGSVGTGVRGAVRESVERGEDYWRGL